MYLNQIENHQMHPFCSLDLMLRLAVQNDKCGTYNIVNIRNRKF